MLAGVGLRKRFVGGDRVTTALDGVDFQIRAGEIRCIAGRSGAGKSTLLKVLLGLEIPGAGHVELDGEKLTAARRSDWRAVRRSVSLVMQDPAASLPPRMRILACVVEPLVALGERPANPLQTATEALAEVGLMPDVLGRFPHQLSGGQLQRVCVARALIAKPRFILADEPSSALDPVTAMGIANLLKSVVSTRQLGLLVISHDPAFVRHLGAIVHIMAGGRIVEEVDAATWALRAAALWDRPR